VRKADNLPPSYAVVKKSGNLNFLEPSGPLQACNGTALPLYITIPKHYKDNTTSHYEKDRIDLVLATTDFCDFQQICYNFIGYKAHYMLHHFLFVAAY